jgi:polyisoprenoid-binding protein YceI
MSGPAAKPPARRTVVTVAGERVSVPAGRWTIDAADSSLRIGVKFGFLGITGRFTEMTGHISTAGDVGSSAIAVTVQTKSLTSGSRQWDALLTAAGLVDATANPTIEFESTHLTLLTGSWALHGVLVTERGCLPVSFALEYQAHDDRRLRFRATGSIRSADAVQLLAAPGVDKVVGKAMSVDLVVAAVRD